jgi:hypothetical protein
MRKPGKNMRFCSISSPLIPLLAFLKDMSLLCLSSESERGSKYLEDRCLVELSYIRLLHL